MRSLLSALGVIALAGVAGGARAQPPPPALTVAYAAPAACPAEAEFTRRLSARLGASRGRGAQSGGRILDVHVAQDNGQYVGTLSLIEPDGRKTTKTLRGRDCDGLIDALSLVAALAVAPDAPVAAGEQRADAAAPAPALRAGPPLADSGQRQVRSSDEGPRSRLAAELGAVAAVGPVPTALLGGQLGIEWAAIRSGALSPALGVGAVAGAAPSVARAGGTANFVWFAARINACVVRLRAARFLTLRGCVLADIGVVNARGTDTVAPRSSSRGWSSLGASSQFELPLGARFGLHVLASVEAPLRRDRYAFGAAEFFEVPVVIATGSVLLATYFP